MTKDIGDFKYGYSLPACFVSNSVFPLYFVCTTTTPTPHTQAIDTQNMNQLQLIHLTHCIGGVRRYLFTLEYLSAIAQAETSVQAFIIFNLNANHN